MRRLVFATLAGLALLVAVAYLALAAGLAWSARELRSELADSASVAVEKTSLAPHAVTLLDDGLASLAARLDLIRGAQHSIDLEFFIYELDFSARWITAELVERARAGVRIRLLVDFAGPVFALRPEYAGFLQAQGIEVRYYNTSPLYRFVSVHHRNHRKLLVVDDHAAIVGGRNIADDYFGLSERYNFLDSDLLVRGEIVGAMRETFDLYWNSQFTRQPEQRPARDFLADRPGDAERRALIEPVARARLAASPAGVCRETAFVTDLPGIAVVDRRVYPAIARAMAAAQTEVVGESPYFVLTGEGAELVRGTVERGVKVSVLTNSLHSTDAFYTVAALWLNLGDVAATGLTLHAFDGHAAPSSPTVPLPETRRGTHAKRAVIDGRDYLIGTYNVDPRSANLNSEMLFICRDGPTIADAARANIAIRSTTAALLAGHGKTDHAALVIGAGPGDIARMLVVMPLAHLFAFLL